jgi:hypothetical protein
MSTSVVVEVVVGPAEPALCVHAEADTDGALEPRATKDPGQSRPTIGTRTSPPFQARSTRRRVATFIVAG